MSYCKECRNAEWDYENGNVQYDMFRMLNAIMRNGNNKAKCHNEEWDCANGNVNYFTGFKLLILHGENAQISFTCQYLARNSVELLYKHVMSCSSGVILIVHKQNTM